MRKRSRLIKIFEERKEMENKLELSKEEVVLDLWDELYANASAVSFAEDELDQDLFRETLYKTWELFGEVIDFDKPEDEYSLPINMARILGEITAYTKLYQIDDSIRGKTVEVSVMIAEIMLSSIIYRNAFSREKPVVKSRRLIGHTVADIEYDLQTGELRLTNPPDDVNNFVISDDGVPHEAEKLAESIATTDISGWWKGYWKM